ncbi:uncharacterized protein LOC124161159 [Ischnura elegans]|uniref:uncharacterized protein LOC124161159 n=1 Tax=Ischnura elegans TaxID=197161 RepID=UPI001ED8BFEB|nr:uncharacterized protein LOC124161159 [Ischnura elegans]
MFLGMAGQRLALVLGIAVLMSFAEGRPQFGDDGIPIRRYRQSDGRHNLEVMQQPSSSQPIRPFSQADGRDEVRDISQSLPVRPFNQRETDDLPVRPFDQYDNRGSTGSSSSRVVPPPSSQPVRPFESTRDQGGRHTSPRREEDPNQSRAHITPLNPRITLQSGRDGQQHRAPQHQHQGTQHQNTQHHTASQRSDEIPHWSSGQVRLDSGPSKAHQSTSTVLHRDNRKTNPQEQSKTSSRVEQSQQGGGPSVRMGPGKGMGDSLDQGKSDGTQEVIVFPGPTKETNKGKFAPGSVAPNCAKGSTFCESVDNYPTEHVKVVLRKGGDTLKEFFGNDLLLNDTSISQRIDSTDENTLCQSVEQVVYPKVAQNKDERWMYVVNQEEYIQGVRVEKCLRPGSECLLTSAFPLGYKTVCRQKYIYRRLLALNNNGEPQSDTFRLPSCCSCFVKAVSTVDRRR